MRRLWISDFTRSRHQIAASFGIDDLRFSFSHWYDGCDLLHLEEVYGAEFMQRLYFHIVAFEVNKLGSLRPDVFDPGPFARFHTPRFEALWRTVFFRVWAQWRYENDDPAYRGPELASRAVDTPPAPVEARPGPVEVLSFCGGGKDSLVAMKLLERGGVPYASFAYSSTIYGTAEPQHRLIGRLLEHVSPERSHRLWSYDDVMDSPVLELYPEYDVRGLLAAETPGSIFSVLPIVLQHGYRYVVLAHERSADVGNLVWEATGEDVNHQWGKSHEAEVLLNDYLREELIGNVSYFSLLKPIHDAVIFNLLRRDLSAVPDTHSCNLRKPWCLRCPKCAYVWLNYMAYLPRERVEEIFPENLLDFPENQLWFRQMLGLEEHTPFECIGQVPEARLAFELCRRKGVEGRAMETFRSEVGTVDVPEIMERFLAVHGAASIPERIAARVLPQMEEAAGEGRRYVAEWTA